MYISTHTSAEIPQTIAPTKTPIAKKVFTSSLKLESPQTNSNCNKSKGQQTCAYFSWTDSDQNNSNEF